MSSSLLPSRRTREDEDLKNQNNSGDDDDDDIQLSNNINVDTSSDDEDYNNGDGDENQTANKTNKKKVTFSKTTQQKNQQEEDDNNNDDDDDDESYRRGSFKNEEANNDEDDENDNNHLLKAAQSKEEELMAAEKNNNNDSSSSKSKTSTTPWNQQQAEAALKILRLLKFPDETAILALKTRLAVGLVPASQPTVKAKRDELIDATTSFDMATALLSSYSGLLSNSSSSSLEKSISQLTRDEILQKLPEQVARQEPPTYLLCWSETAPIVTSEFCANAVAVKTIFGPCQIAELDNWCGKGFFEKKQAFVMNVNELKREQRIWMKVPRKTQDKVELL